MIVIRHLLVIGFQELANSLPFYAKPPGSSRPDVPIPGVGKILLHTAGLEYVKRPTTKAQRHGKEQRSLLPELVSPVF
jgi:hypothetical protein